MAKTQKRRIRNTSRKNTRYSKRQSSRKSLKRSSKKVRTKNKNKRNIRSRRRINNKKNIFIGGGRSKEIRLKINEFQKILNGGGTSLEKVNALYKTYEELYKLTVELDLTNKALVNNREALNEKIMAQRSQLVDFLRFEVESVNRLAASRTEDVRSVSLLEELLKYIIDVFEKVGEQTSNFLTDKKSKNRLENFNDIQSSLAFSFFLLVKMYFINPNIKHTLKTAKKELDNFLKNLPTKYFTKAAFLGRAPNLGKFAPNAQTVNELQKMDDVDKVRESIRVVMAETPTDETELQELSDAFDEAIERSNERLIRELEAETENARLDDTRETPLSRLSSREEQLLDDAQQEAEIEEELRRIEEQQAAFAQQSSDLAELQAQQEIAERNAFMSNMGEEQNKIKQLVMGADMLKMNYGNIDLTKDKYRELYDILVNFAMNSIIGNLITLGIKAEQNRNIKREEGTEFIKRLIGIINLIVEEVPKPEDYEKKLNAKDVSSQGSSPVSAPTSGLDTDSTSDAGSTSGASSGSSSVEFDNPALSQDFVLPSASEGSAGSENSGDFSTFLEQGGLNSSLSAAGSGNRSLSAAGSGNRSLSAAGSDYTSASSIDQEFIENFYGSGAGGVASTSGASGVGSVGSYNSSLSPLDQQAIDYWQSPEAGGVGSTSGASGVGSTSGASGVGSSSAVTGSTSGASDSVSTSGDSGSTSGDSNTSHRSADRQADGEAFADLAGFG